jgi:hypothetical protein
LHILGVLLRAQERHPYLTRALRKTSLLPIAVVSRPVRGTGSNVIILKRRGSSGATASARGRRRSLQRHGRISSGLVSPIHVLPIANLHDGDNQLVIQNLVDDAVLSDADAPEVLGARELAAPGGRRLPASATSAAAIISRA